MKTGVYLIRNTANNKIYIGSSASRRGIVDRWYQHKSALKNQRHVNKHLQNAATKHGLSVFKLEILELCEPEQCLEKEQHYLDLYKSYLPNIGYNLCKTAGNTLGRTHSPETKLKISANRVYKSPSNKGLLATAEQKRNMSIAQQNSPKTQNHIKKLNLSKRRPVLGVHIKTGEILHLTHAGADKRFINSGIVQSCKGKIAHYKSFKWSYQT